MTNTNFAILLSFFILLSGCEGVCYTKPGYSSYWKLRKSDNVSNSNSILIKDYDALPIDNRLDIFLYATGCVNDQRFEPILALSGAKIVPNVIRRIETEPQMLDKANLLNVLVRIERKCSCVASDQETIRHLEAISQGASKSDPYLPVYRNNLQSLRAAGKSQMTPSEH